MEVDLKRCYNIYRTDITPAFLKVFSDASVASLLLAFLTALCYVIAYISPKVIAFNYLVWCGKDAESTLREILHTHLSYADAEELVGEVINVQYFVLPIITCVVFALMSFIAFLIVMFYNKSQRKKFVGYLEEDLLSKHRQTLAELSSSARRQELEDFMDKIGIDRPGVLDEMSLVYILHIIGIFIILIVVLYCCVVGHGIPEVFVGGEEFLDTLHMILTQ